MLYSLWTEAQAQVSEVTLRTNVRSDHIRTYTEVVCDTDVTSSDSLIMNWKYFTIWSGILFDCKSCGRHINLTLLSITHKHIKTLWTGYKQLQIPVYLHVKQRSEIQSQVISRDTRARCETTCDPSPWTHLKTRSEQGLCLRFVDMCLLSTSESDNHLTVPWIHQQSRCGNLFVAQSYIKTRRPGTNWNGVFDGKPIDMSLWKKMFFFLFCILLLCVCYLHLRCVLVRKQEPISPQNYNETAQQLTGLMFW